MNEQKQQKDIEPTLPNTQVTAESMLGSTAVSLSRKIHFAPVKYTEQSWNLHLSGVDSIPITKV